MKAIGYTRIGAPDVLMDVEVETPKPGPRDLLVKVKAVSLNPVDFKVRKGAAPVDGRPKIIGYDAAGTVVSVGADVSLFKEGDDVFYSGTIDRPGTNAELHVVDERLVGRKPATLTFPEAAALPLTGLTAWELLFDRLAVPYGSKTAAGTLLVINGAGGVGSILIQLARKLTGLTVVATASRSESIEWAKKMGAHHVVSHHEPLVKGVRSLGFHHVDYVAGLTDTARHMEAIAEIIRPQGSLSIIDDGALDIGPLKPKSVRATWEMIFTRPLFQTEDMAEQHRILSEIADLVDAGILRTTSTTVLNSLSAETIRRGHEMLESGRTIGKIVVDLGR
ncbi:zinc-binding alcohol dehydrogenase family protein [Rhizobium leguminosarum]|uniref:zinc-binding alcohol dehydrogenase family protein n=1 Tax=Rhizobium leguminosarum TaxID=384 RepID=UPI0024A9E318|nr:zinc-binding alcohol dehydrogenase family protein [Rhizobium leguminosarum]MDI5929777.1 zinc-binding alcohol dehydrogenase family protein [Rhizobium leguminosarum]